MPKKIKQPVVLDPGEDISISRNQIYIADGAEEIAVVGFYSGHTVRLDGTAKSNYHVIYLGSTNDVANNVVRIASTGLIKSKEGITSGDGVQMLGSTNTFVNHGTVESVGRGLVIASGAAAGSTTITNSGSITGESGLYVNTNDTVSLRNTGTIRGDEIAYQTDFLVHVDRIVNSGKMFGNIFLTGGDDVYNGKSGMVRGFVSGGDGADKLTGGKENNELFGNIGEDRLTGGRGADRLTGGTEADMFIFTSAGDSSVKSSGRDLILDFNQAQFDILDLGGIDAKEGKKGDQSFTFIADDNFHKKAGELHYDFKSGNTIVSGDTDGDGKADFSIALAGEIALTKDDFML